VIAFWCGFFLGGFLGCAGGIFLVGSFQRDE